MWAKGRVKLASEPKGKRFGLFDAKGRVVDIKAPIGPDWKGANGVKPILAVMVGDINDRPDVAWTTSRKALCCCLPRASQAYRSAGGLAYGRQARRDRSTCALPDDRRYQ